MSTDPTRLRVNAKRRFEQVIDLLGNVDIETRVGVCKHNLGNDERQLQSSLTNLLIFVMIVLFVHFVHVCFEDLPLLFSITCFIPLLLSPSACWPEIYTIRRQWKRIKTKNEQDLPSFSMNRKSSSPPLDRSSSNVCSSNMIGMKYFVSNKCHARLKQRITSFHIAKRRKSHDELEWRDKRRGKTHMPAASLSFALQTNIVNAFRSCCRTI